jgi:hypothetical protein
VDDAERIPSPDGVYTVLLVPVEMRMSHWLAQPWIVDTATNQTILDLTATLWSADTVRWADDSARVTLAMRRYPGDAPGVTVAIDLRTGMAMFDSPVESATVALSRLSQWLEAFYQQHRRRA